MRRVRVSGVGIEVWVSGGLGRGVGGGGRGVGVGGLGAWGGGWGVGGVEWGVGSCGQRWALEFIQGPKISTVCRSVLYGIKSAHEP
jgi:hypothetical protein